MDLITFIFFSIEIFILFRKVWTLEEKIKEMEGVNNE